mgnify:CR=1 FL=1
MSAQTKYGYSTPIGAAGGIVDVAPHQIDTFLNEEENGVLKFGEFLLLLPLRNRRRYRFHQIRSQLKRPARLYMPLLITF